jgi:hypothetical protein
MRLVLGNCSEGSVRGADDVVRHEALFTSNTEGFSLLL